MFRDEIEVTPHLGPALRVALCPWRSVATVVSVSPRSSTPSRRWWRSGLSRSRASGVDGQRAIVAVNAMTRIGIDDTAGALLLIRCDGPAAEVGAERCEQGCCEQGCCGVGARVVVRLTTDLEIRTVRKLCSRSLPVFERRSNTKAHTPGKFAGNLCARSVPDTLFRQICLE